MQEATKLLTNTQIKFHYVKTEIMRHEPGTTLLEATERALQVLRDHDELNMPIHELTAFQICPQCLKLNDYASERGQTCSKCFALNTAEMMVKTRAKRKGK